MQEDIKILKEQNYDILQMIYRSTILQNTFSEESRAHLLVLQLAAQNKVFFGKLLSYNKCFIFVDENIDT